MNFLKFSFPTSEEKGRESCPQHCELGVMAMAGKTLSDWTAAAELHIRKRL